MGFLLVRKKAVTLMQRQTNRGPRSVRLGVLEACRPHAVRSSRRPGVPPPPARWPEPWRGTIVVPPWKRSSWSRPTHLSSSLTSQSARTDARSPIRFGVYRVMFGTMSDVSLRQFHSLHVLGASSDYVSVEAHGAKRQTYCRTTRGVQAEGTLDSCTAQLRKPPPPSPSSKKEVVFWIGHGGCW